jgi:hypothetical protein
VQHLEIRKSFLKKNFSKGNFGAIITCWLREDLKLQDLTTSLPLRKGLPSKKEKKK